MGYATLSNIIGRALLEECQQRGIDVLGLLADLKIAPRSIDFSDSRLTLDESFAIWQETHRLVQDPDFAIKASERFQYYRDPLVFQLLATSSTLEDALQNFIRYFDLIDPYVEVTISKEGSNPTLNFRPRSNPKKIGSDYVALLMVYFQRMISVILSNEWSPIHIRLAFEVPESTRMIYQSLFKCPVGIQAPINQIVLDPTQLLRKMPEANPEVHTLLMQFANERLHKVSRPSKLVDDVREILTKTLNQGDTSLESVAKGLGVSPRTLQRKLKNEGVSYQDVLDQHRCELVIRLLREKKLPMTDLAAKLGFSEPSSFYKAFRRWTGRSPEAFRN